MQKLRIYVRIILVINMKNSITHFFEIKSDQFIYKHIREDSACPEVFYLHTHEVPELLYIIEANGSHIIEDREYPLKKNDLVIVPPASYHQIKLNSPSPYERYNICFDPEILKNIDIDSIYKKIEVINCANHKIISDIFKKTDYYSKVLNPKDFKDMTQMLIREIFYNLSVYDGLSNTEAIVLSPLLSEALTFINENLFTLKSISEISRKLYITDGHLFEIFKSQLKITPKNYINSKRLHTARQEISMGAKPTEVYERVGFNDYTSFYRNYVRFFGHSPSQEKLYGFSNEKFE